MASHDPEEQLPGVITAAVRIGPTVHRPAVPVADALLTHLEAAGFTGAPRYLGRDEQGRSVLSWLEGWCPGQHEDHLIGEPALRAVGALLRRYHDAVAGYHPAGSGAEFEEGPRARGPGQLVCYGDIAPRNTVFRDGLPVAFPIHLPIPLHWTAPGSATRSGTSATRSGSSPRCATTPACTGPAGRTCPAGKTPGWPGPPRWPAATAWTARPGAGCPPGSPP
jgi:hypothetical protein